MPLFATPDFGSGGAIVCCAGVILLAVVALSLLGIRWGIRLRRRESLGARRVGTVMVAVCCLLPIATCCGPSVYTRLSLGRFPLGLYPSGVITEGMTQDEVLERLGRPNTRHRGPEDESWYYYIDSLGASYFAVRFGPDGRVVGTHGN